MLVVPSGGIIIELGNLCMQLHFRENNALSKYAAPGNAYYDFIPTVLKYYKNEGIEVEDVSVIFEKDMFKCLGYQLEEYEIENYVKKLEELRKYCSENNIRFISMDSDDSAYIEYINKNNNPFFCNNKKFSVDLDAIWNPFFQNTSFSNNFSLLITDCDGTIMTHHEKIDEELNFELMRSFLKAGNVILIVTSGSHEESLFHENKDSSRLWNLLGEYKNQVIGFPAFCSGITLDDIRIPIGNSGIHKKDMVKPLVQMFIDRGYDINQVFCIGDDALDLDMIVETSHLLNGIAYHIRKTDQCQCNREQISHFTEEDWKYIDDHGIGSFSDFMEQIVLPNLNIEKLNDKIKVWK